MQKRLYKSEDNRILCGVCGGVGEYLGVDPTLVRLVWVLITLAAGAGLLLYIIAAIIMPTVERCVVDGEMEMKTFKELYLAGEIEFEAIDDYVMEWGNSEDERTLAQYLGLNADEEDAWVSDSEEAMKELLDRQKK